MGKRQRAAGAGGVTQSMQDASPQGVHSLAVLLLPASLTASRGINSEGAPGAACPRSHARSRCLGLPAKKEEEGRRDEEKELREWDCRQPCTMMIG
ncbi:hypothetical protein BHM03_00016497 [Ensete ventricosum]|nr:hypothetical protein BHM03_00016497 [Ensete ventricosum]